MRRFESCHPDQFVTYAGKMNKFTHDIFAVGGAASFGAVEKAKQSSDLMHAVLIQLSPEVHVTYGTAFQILAIFIGVVGFAFGAWDRIKARRKKQGFK